MVAIGEAEGIQFAFENIERTPNTVDAHRLIWLADKQGIQDAVVEGLFRAYFAEGRDIGNRQTLHHQRHVTLSGAQPSDAFLAAFSQALGHVI
jgi:predicted DsbA family dithiol-disulfide isomerase